MRQGFFVTGTDTGVGKSLVSAALLQAFATRGMQVAGMKPVASGCRVVDGELRNDDADMLSEVATVSAPYATVCPYRFEPPIAPHIAAGLVGQTIDRSVILARYHELARLAELVVVEGVGGWAVPLGGRLLLADLAEALDLPVIVVVGGRLGCINHALLTCQAIAASGLSLAGWVFNQIEPDMRHWDYLKLDG